jgi:electron transfer flavoprotein alpha subunit
MSILVFAEHDNGNFKKSSFEAITYAKDLAVAKNTTVVAVVIGKVNSKLEELGNCGANSVISVSGNQTENFTAEAYSEIIAKIASEQNANTLIISNTYSGKSIAPRVAVKLNAGIISGVISLPDTDSVVKKTAFSNKAIASTKLTSDKKVLCLTPNSYEIKNFGLTASLNEVIIDIDASSIHTKSLNTSKASGKVALTEAEIVVSGGRGMKGPENWGLIEELADLLGAATACSKPVSDMDWRPHSEHVGQTGITIKPNLYIAVGISGAIQHLAGVSSSKVICVINKDAEAPFFKAADYGIVGDAFEILPKLIERAKHLKNS